MTTSPANFRAPVFSALGWLLAFAPIHATATNYDEAKVGDYTLPDPLVCNDGSRVTNAETWFVRRRPEILESYRTEIFGHSADAGTNVTFNVWETSTHALVTREPSLQTSGSGSV